MIGKYTGYTTLIKGPNSKENCDNMCMCMLYISYTFLYTHIYIYTYVHMNVKTLSFILKYKSLQTKNEISKT